MPEDLCYAYTYMCEFLMHAPVYESSPVKQEIFLSKFNFSNVPLRNRKWCAVIYTKVDACSGKVPVYRVFLYIYGIFLKIVRVFTIQN
jgi:hypothetical protein